MEEYLTLRKIARETGISESYINTIFLRHAKLPPKQYYIRLKIRHACELLHESGIRVSQVADQLGYQNQFYFSKSFKQVVGISPKQYAKELAG